MDIHDREELLILFGSAQAIVSAQSDDVRIIPNTEKNYGMIYERWLLAGRQISPELAGPTRRWWISAVRFKTLQRLRGSTAELERALRTGDDANAISAGAVVRECIGILERHPAGRPGKRAKIRDEKPPAPRRAYGPRTAKQVRGSREIQGISELALREQGGTP